MAGQSRKILGKGDSSGRSGDDGAKSNGFAEPCSALRFGLGAN